MLFSILLLAATACAQFSSEVEAILARPAFANATVGIQIRRSAGELVYERNPYLSLVPASNQKIVTGSLALKVLGEAYRYDTRVLTTAETNQGVIDGNIFLQGSGDPSLTSDRLADMARQVADAGVTNITGKVIGDGARFDSRFLGEGWSWDDEALSFSAQVAGLNCDGNFVNVTVAPGEAGGPAIITVNGLGLDEETYVEVQANVETTSSGEADLSFDRVRGRNIITVSGAVPAGAQPETEQVTIENPIAYTAYRFALALRKAGVEISTEIETGQSGGVELASSSSEPLSQILRWFLKPSDNMYGEALLKTTGSGGSSASGVLTLQSFLEEANIDSTGVRTVDGSGLSRMDALTAQFLCDLLAHIKTFPNSDVFVDALPSGGVDGTLSSRFTTIPGKVRAKTASLTGVSSLSGYLTAANEEQYIFSILINQATSATQARTAQDDIVMALYNM